MTDALTNTLDDLEAKVMATLDNPYCAYCVQIPYSVSFTIPDDGHQTSITIESRSEILRYGRDEQDIHHQMRLDQAHGGSTIRRSTHQRRNNTKQRYTTQTSLRLSTDLRESIDTVCDAYKVTPVVVCYPTGRRLIDRLPKSFWCVVYLDRCIPSKSQIDEKS